MTDPGPALVPNRYLDAVKRQRSLAAPTMKGLAHVLDPVLKAFQAGAWKGPAGSGWRWLR